VTPGLTDSPRADTANPAAKMLRAALTSRSWITPHSGQDHSLILTGILDMTNPQSEHRLLEGDHRSMPIRVRPYQAALYANCRMNSDQLASRMLLFRPDFCLTAYHVNIKSRLNVFPGSKPFANGGSNLDSG
jgi:hypothetical protein